ncbi:MAG: hypothetical protein J5792_03015 [Bacteroidales bacterium]|nr:hypothetical protein [Bacteroidales bacterium]
MLWGNSAPLRRDGCRPAPHHPQGNAIQGIIPNGERTVPHRTLLPPGRSSGGCPTTHPVTE